MVVLVGSSRTTFLKPHDSRSSLGTTCSEDGDVGGVLGRLERREGESERVNGARHQTVEAAVAGQYVHASQQWGRWL